MPNCVAFHCPIAFPMGFYHTPKHKHGRRDFSFSYAVPNGLQCFNLFAGIAKCTMKHCTFSACISSPYPFRGFGVRAGENCHHSPVLWNVRIFGFSACFGGLFPSFRFGACHCIPLHIHSAIIGLYSIRPNHAGFACTFPLQFSRYFAVFPFRHAVGVSPFRQCHCTMRVTPL